MGGPFAPYRQSERLDDLPRRTSTGCSPSGHAYHCWCTAERLAEMREEQQKAQGADRLRPALPRQDARRARGAAGLQRAAGRADAHARRRAAVFDDLIRGEVKAPRPDDQVLLKADGFPTYHLAVVVDDHLMGITHVVRGEEWISSTPKHLLLYDWLGWERPQFAHMPLLRNADKTQDLQAQEPGCAADLVPRAGLPARGAAQLPRRCSATRCPTAQEVFSFDEMSRPSTGRASAPSARSSTSTSSAGSTATTSASSRSTTSPAGIAAHLSRVGVLPAEPTARAARPRRARRPRTSASAWRCCPRPRRMLGFLFVDDDDFTIEPESRRCSAEGPDAARCSRRAVAALEPLDDWTTAGDRGGAAVRRSSRASASSRSSRSGRCGSPSPDGGSRRRCSSRSSCSGRDRALRRLRAAISQVAWARARGAVRRRRHVGGPQRRPADRHRRLSRRPRARPRCRRSAPLARCRGAPLRTAPDRRATFQGQRRARVREMLAGDGGADLDDATADAWFAGYTTLFETDWTTYDDVGAALAWWRRARSPSAS